MNRPPRLLPAVLLLALALVAAACNGSAETTRPSGSATASPSAVAGSPVPSGSDIPTESPATEPAPTEPTATDSPEPTASEPDNSPGASTTPGPAAACAGTDKNRTFYAQVARAVDWTVYCPVLPSGWFVISGEYRLAGGGRMEIAYRGPNGARLELHEGAFCTKADGCVPPGTDVEEASVGDLIGMLVSLDDGGWAIVVDRGEPMSYLTVGTNLGEAAFRNIAAGLVAIPG